ncbi:hypothetical protein VNPA120661_11290 [Pseudomonas aeruginosa]|nr:hypothetical protein VNPA110516_04270 [Pseudomonas aeruginosa]GLE68147.1 hypothetical protein VNPA110517_19810 [Pseudomonas aeruginosa]GLE80816.1 hypothetical protein VNPA120661_11290 [Pseudomonas aeruginosa]GLE95107.1 hypothetical protein VNPA120840_19520 [Pseudomonas aeruginosa]GLF01897.1 hypothetical protein VNPA120889_20470 [Pseudomonas aeruginosa]
MEYFTPANVWRTLHSGPVQALAGIPQGDHRDRAPIQELSHWGREVMGLIDDHVSEAWLDGRCTAERNLFDPVVATDR